MLEEDAQSTSLTYPPVASKVAESSGPGAPLADASPNHPPNEYVCPQAEDTPARQEVSVEKCHLEKPDGLLSWKAWAASDKKQNEDKHLRPFEKIFQAVKVKEPVEKRSGLTAAHTYKIETEEAPTSERDERMCPDACILREPAKNRREGQVFLVRHRMCWLYH